MLQFSNRYYSTYGHVGKLAEEIKKGASSVEGVEAKIWQVTPDHLCCSIIQYQFERFHLTRLNASKLAPKGVWNAHSWNANLFLKFLILVFHYYLGFSSDRSLKLSLRKYLERWVHHPSLTFQSSRRKNLQRLMEFCLGSRQGLA
jgi:hypothetical protein